jgi:phosphate-selective porin OprO/OprP
MTFRRHQAWAYGGAVAILGFAAQARAQNDDDAARLSRLEASVAALQAQVAAEKGLAAENAALRGEVTALRTKVDSLSASAPSAASAAAGGPETIQTIPTTASAGNAPAVTSTFAKGEPGIATADGRFSANLYALIQLDAAYYDQQVPGPITTDLRRSGPALGASSSNVDDSHARDLKDGDEFRRARFGISGNAFGDFDYRIIFDFGGSGVENAGQLYEGWAQYSGWRPFYVRVGAFAPQQGLADQDSNSAQPLLDRPISADIARNLAAGDTRTAIQAFGEGDRWLASFAVTGRDVGVVSSSGTGVAQTYGDPLNLVSRAVFRPYQTADSVIHLGVHGEAVVTPADTTGPNAAGPTPAVDSVVSFSDTPELRVDATKLINTGNIDARHAYDEGAEFAAQWRGFLVQSEYDAFQVQRVLTGVGDPHFQGWYVEASWIPSGVARHYNNGTAAFDAPPVLHPVGQGGLGVVQFTFRYSTMDLDYDAGSPGTAPTASAIRGGDMSIWTAGVDWYLNPYVRLAFEGQHVELGRLSPNAALYLTPIGAQIGQSYNAFAIRSQFGF